ncbi:MAG: M48 family metalloprotease [Gammaproteobacteria bacterium]|nr:M48 family metalloprotease [Gammaproteobacteria bacterium]
MESLYKSSNLLRSVLVIAIAFVLSACAGNPTGGANFVLMSESAELEKGRELHAEMLQQNPIYQDPELQAYVEKVGQKMAAVSHRPELDYVFTIIDSPDINAFALPGGFVYVNRGLLTYLNSEAQLAAVLGHEIGHVTARHAVRQQTAARSANAASIALIFATGVDLRETTSLISGALISGYGRDMELEADSLGAEYLSKAGYDPLAMVQVIEVLKNHEDFTKRTSNRTAISYHGLFASHPRNDTRLQEVVGKAAELSDRQASEEDPVVFREQITGLIVGPSPQNVAGGDQRNRYYQSLFNYTLLLPEGWSKQETTTTMTSASVDGSSMIKVEAQRLQQSKEPRLFIRENLGIENLQQSEPLSQFGLSGFTGINPESSERVAVLYYGPRAFILTAKAGEGISDELLMESVRSFRPIARNETLFANPVQISYIQADGKITYADLARQTRLPEHQEDMLRLLNGDYPFGEPAAGQWVKVAN